MIVVLPGSEPPRKAGSGLGDCHLCRRSPSFVEPVFESGDPDERDDILAELLDFVALALQKRPR